MSYVISKLVREVHEENKQACRVSVQQASAMMYKPSRSLHQALLPQPTVAKPPSCRRHAAKTWLHAHFYKTTDRGDCTRSLRNPVYGGSRDFGRLPQRFRAAINDKHKPAPQPRQTVFRDCHDDGTGQCSIKAPPMPL